jgi:hypothetical protein
MQLGHFGLFFACVSFISGLIFNFFIDIFLVSFQVEKRNFIIPLFSAPIPLFSFAPKKKQRVKIIVNG